MYETFWDLTARPFENGADPRFYYPSEVHQGSLLKLRYAIENQRGAALLTGASGTGKTMLVQSLKRQCGETYTPFVHVVFPQMTTRELLTYIAVEFGALGDSPAAQPIDETVRALERFLAENTARGRHAILAVDEAQMLLDGGGLETLRLLLNIEPEARPSLTLLVVGHAALLPALERMTELECRLGVKSLLRPFTLEETVSYVNHRMTAAGASHEIFTTDGLTTLHRLTGGNPRRINRLCDLALLIGYADEQPSIGPDQFEAVAHELVAVAPD
jgi:general secretion pathway protein A